MGKKWVGFDPTGLERAAKAARELDKSGKCFSAFISWIFIMAVCIFVILSVTLYIHI